MEHLQVEEIGFDQHDLDAALDELAIDTTLPIEIQRSIASRVLISSSLAAAISSDDEYRQAIARLGGMPEDPVEMAFFGDMARGLVSDLAEGMGEQAIQFDVLTRRIGELAGAHA